MSVLGGGRGGICILTEPRLAMPEVQHGIPATPQKRALNAARRRMILGAQDPISPFHPRQIL
jgi:hypothetical protein